MKATAALLRVAGAVGNTSRRASNASAAMPARFFHFRAISISTTLPLIL
jgi:hypothetical protein